MNNAIRNVKYLAIVAIALAVAAPFVEDAVLGTLNIHTPVWAGLTRLNQVVERQGEQSTELDSQIASVAKDTAVTRAQVTSMQAKFENSQSWTRTLALVQLGAVLRRPGPFDLELAFVRATNAAPADLASLLTKIEPYAATGIQSIGQLRTQFSDLRGRAGGNQDGYLPNGWVSEVINLPRAIVTPGAAGPAKVDPDAKTLATAAALLNRDNLAGAVTSMQQVTGSSRDLFTEWMEDASARVAADTVAQRINDLVVLGGPLGQPVSVAKPAGHP